ncbi:putative metalloprotease CJM1_0395 family protein [Flocculibacter collagenilyticus]|uniref:putative metalloprotease CJM1_0395 family protein n=1 Tax=Flocculibacter collagenilyticus TaxID=2744479 RepID=UPI001F25C74B|nr:putative metalloprotease CJM1_0395 family protein [Flocculibacter collagenilyticus]
MNIATPYPTHIPMSNANPATEAAKRDSDARQLIVKTEEMAAGNAEKGVGAESDRAKSQSALVQSPVYEFPSNDKSDKDEIHEREKNPDQDSSQQEPSQDSSQNDASGSDSSQSGDTSGDTSGENQDANGSTEDAQSDAERREQELELKQVQELKQRDAEVKAHEQAHAAIGGSYAGAPSYEYETGPDGAKYAVSGEVSIDTAPVPDDARATIEKMETVRAAALAPAEPSSQDRSVAAQATQELNAARADLLRENAEALSEQKEKATELNETDEVDNTLSVAPEDTAFFQQAIESPFDVDAGTLLQKLPDAIELSDDDRLELQEHSELGLSAPVDIVQRYVAQLNIAEQATAPPPLQFDRAAEINERAARIQNFYQAATSPANNNQFSQLVG